MNRQPHVERRWLPPVRAMVLALAIGAAVAACSGEEVTPGSAGICVPECSGTWCGDDGCGGQCGVCPAWAPVCEQGTCQMEVPPGTGDALDADSGAGLDAVSAGDGTGPGPTDGTPGKDSDATISNPADGVVNPDAGCVPDCAGKMCGADGCGGVCSLCPPQAPFCDGGQCTSCDTDSCGGMLDGNPLKLCSVYDPSFGSGTVKCDPACQLDISQCVVASQPGEHGSVCNPNQAAACDDPLLCLPLEAAGSSSYCLAVCASDTSCPEGWSCVPISQTTQVCMPATAQRDAPCWENFQACSDPSHQCMNTANVNGQWTDWRCKVVCDEIGATVGCPGGETCLKNTNGHFVPVKEDGAWKTCLSELDPCGGAQACLSVGGGNFLCYDPVGWCGTAVPLCVGLGSAEHAQCAEDDPCEATDASLYCTVGTGDPLAFPNPGFAVCVDVPGNPNGACVGFCELENGEIAQCGTGYSCVQPSPGEAMLFYASQPAGPASCANNSTCDTAGQYFCATLSTDPQPRCYRGYRMCKGL